MDDVQGQPAQPGTNAAESPKDIASVLEEGRQQRAEATAPKEQREPQEQHRDPADARGPGETRIPLAALHAEKARRKAAQERTAQLENEITELRAAQLARQPEPVNPDSGFWMDPDRALSQSRMDTNMRLSTSEFRAEYGKAVLDDLDATVERAWQSGHPDIPYLSQAMRSSDDPVGVVKEWAETALGWRPGAQSQAQAQGRGSVFPSNLAGARNVGVRSGPGYSGPTPLGDILSHRKSVFKR